MSKQRSKKRDGKAKNKSEQEYHQELGSTIEDDEDRNPGHSQMIKKLQVCC
jgi:hypothetical protein